MRNDYSDIWAITGIVLFVIALVFGLAYAFGGPNEWAKRCVARGGFVAHMHKSSDLCIKDGLIIEVEP